MSFNNIKIFDKILNLIHYSNIENIENLDSIISDNIDIDISKVLQDEYIKTYAKEFIDYFNAIDERNEYESEESGDDDDETLRYKQDLYDQRIEAIKYIKAYFLKSIFYIKRFKGTQEYIEFILSFYVNMKYYNQYDLELDSEESSGYLIPNERYLITLTTVNYFGTNKVVGNIIEPSTSLLLNANNRVQRLISKDNTIINSGLAQYNKKYIIIKNTGTDITLIPGNTLLYQNVPELLEFSENLIVKEVIPIIVEKIKDFIYIIQSIISEEEYNIVIKPLVHPVGWLSYYYEMNYNDSNEEYLQTKNIDISNNITHQNLNYYYHNIALNDIRSNSLIETLFNNGIEDIYSRNANLLNRSSQLDFCLMNTNITDGKFANTSMNFILEFSRDLETTYADNFVFVRSTDDLPIAFDILKKDNKVYINNTDALDTASNYTITVSQNLEDELGNLLSNDNIFYLTNIFYYHFNYTTDWIDIPTLTTLGATSTIAFYFKPTNWAGYFTYPLVNYIDTDNSEYIKFDNGTNIIYRKTITSSSDMVFYNADATSNIVASTGIITINAQDLTVYSTDVGLEVGDSITLANCAEAGNNSTFTIGSIDYNITTALATTITVTAPGTMVDETDSTPDWTITSDPKTVIKERHPTVAIPHDDAWHTFLITINHTASEVFMYLDNTLLTGGTDTEDGIIWDEGGNFSIGDTIRRYKDDLKHFIVTSSIVSSDERTNFEDEDIHAIANVELWYKGNETIADLGASPYTDTIIDYSGNANHGTPTGITPADFCNFNP